jgi:hypothetical protein
LKVEKDVVKPTLKLTHQIVLKLLQELGESNKVNLNILKNAFDSYEEYRSIVDIETETALGVESNIKVLELAEKIEIEYKSKVLSGKALLQLPLISKETGKWDE